MPSVQLVRTRRFNIFTCPGADDGSGVRRDIFKAYLRSSSLAPVTSRTATAHCTLTRRCATSFDVPYMSLRELNAQNSRRFIGLMERHGFVVLTGIGTIRAVYLNFIHLLRVFFDEPSRSKEACKGSVYFNERGIPMWHAGYEQCGRVREAFRMPASLASLPGRPWPSSHLREAWLRLLRLLQRVCHQALVLTLGEETAGALPPPATNPGCAIEAEGVEERQANGEQDCCSPNTLAIGSRPQEGDDAWCDDISVSYALRYPNDFADPALEKENLTVGEHVDPSLYVVEPCCGVEGLEIQDRLSGRWFPVEALCASLGGGGSELDEAEGRELILFGGKALERATDGKMRGAPHRVRRGDDGPRHCFIYEQKYASFFPPPAMD